MSEKHFGEIEEGDELKKAIQEAADSSPDEEEKEDVLEGAVDVSSEEIKKAAQAGQMREEQEK
ncbi:MAG: hypothetical protein AAB630_01180 [Patescibacteria group bacterium]